MISAKFTITEAEYVELQRLYLENDIDKSRSVRVVDGFSLLADCGSHYRKALLDDRLDESYTKIVKAQNR